MSSNTITALIYYEILLNSVGDTVNTIVVVTYNDKGRKCQMPVSRE